MKLEENIVITFQSASNVRNPSTSLKSMHGMLVSVLCTKRCLSATEYFTLTQFLVGLAGFDLRSPPSHLLLFSVHKKLRKQFTEYTLKDIAEKLCIIL